MPSFASDEDPEVVTSTELIGTLPVNAQATIRSDKNMDGTACTTRLNDRRRKGQQDHMH